jgi:multisubunit Na+/H+ antiporter MnhG subunit
MVLLVIMASIALWRLDIFLKKQAPTHRVGYPIYIVIVIIYTSIKYFSKNIKTEKTEKTENI